MVGFLPPSSSTAGVRFCAAALCTIFPTGGLPVKKIRSHFWASSAVVSGIPPSTTATASGSRYLGTISAVCAAVASAISDGFSTAVFPAAIAATSGASVSMYGSFQAPMIKVTPNGSRRTRTWPGSISRGVGSCTGLTQSCRCFKRVVRLADVVVDVHQVGVGPVAPQVVP